MLYTNGRGISPRPVQHSLTLRFRHDTTGSPAAVEDTLLLESLILAQDERWRRALYMQVERGPWELAPGRPSGERVRNT